MNKKIILIADEGKIIVDERGAYSEQIIIDFDDKYDYKEIDKPKEDIK